MNIVKMETIAYPDIVEAKKILSSSGITPISISDPK